MKTTKSSIPKNKVPTARSPRKKIIQTDVKSAASPAPAPREIPMELIAARAYTLWEKQGRPQGNDLQNWLHAENQLKQEIQSFTA